MTTEAFADSDRDGCIRAFQRAHEECLSALAHCMDRPALETSGDLYQCLLDCADLCRTAADFLSRASKLSSKICVLASAACDDLVTACRRHADDARLREVSRTARQTAGACIPLTRPTIDQTLVAEEDR